MNSSDAEKAKQARQEVYYEFSPVCRPSKTAVPVSEFKNYVESKKGNQAFFSEQFKVQYPKLLSFVNLINIIKEMLTLHTQISSDRNFIPAYNSLQLLLWRQEISQRISTRIYIRVRMLFIHLITVNYTYPFVLIIMNIFFCQRLFKCFVDDETRVLLKIEKGSSDSDFINASFIHVCFLYCRYNIVK